MSALVADASREQDNLLSHPDRNPKLSSGGQNHDRTRDQTSQMAGLQSSSMDGQVEVTALQRMSSAMLGSLVTSILATPLDVVRIRLQSQSSPSPFKAAQYAANPSSFQKLPPNLGVTACCREVFWVGDNAQYCLAGPAQTLNSSATTSLPDCAAEETRRKTFTSTFDGLRKIAKNEGPLTLWRGLSPTLLMAIPANVIYFTGYDWLRFSHTSPITRIANDTYSPLLAGSIARVAAAFVVSPIEMFRTRMQASSGSGTGLFASTLQSLHQMTQTQGYSSLWRGITLTMWRDVPFSGFYWWGYEAVRNAMTDARIKARNSSAPLIRKDLTPTQSSRSRRLSQSQEKHTTTFIDSFIAGNVSGAFAAFITTPFDVGKTRQQVYRHAGDDGKSAIDAAQRVASSSSSEAVKKLPEELSMPRFLYHIASTEGMSGLFRGWAARCLKVAPSCGIMISSYELGKKYARVVNDKKAADKHEPL